MNGLIVFAPALLSAAWAVVGFAYAWRGSKPVITGFAGSDWGMIPPKGWLIRRRRSDMVCMFAYCVMSLISTFVSGSRIPLLMMASGVMTGMMIEVFSEDLARWKSEEQNGFQAIRTGFALNYVELRLFLTFVSVLWGLMPLIPAQA